MYININENKIFLDKNHEIKLENITNYIYNINNEIISNEKKYLLSIITMNEKFNYLFKEEFNTIYNITILDNHYNSIISNNFSKSYFQSIDLIYKNQKKYFLIKFHIFI